MQNISTLSEFGLDTNIILMIGGKLMYQTIKYIDKLKRILVKTLIRILNH